MRTRLELQASQQLRSPNDFGTGQIPGQRCTLEILETNPGLPASVGWGERLGIVAGQAVPHWKRKEPCESAYRQSCRIHVLIR